MGWKYYKGGNAKKKQLEDLERYCIYHKEGNKFVVDYVFLEPITTIKEHKKKNYPQLKLNKEEWENKGIYAIKLGNQIYIGSTTRGFKQRFREHLYGTLDSMKHTQELLKQGGEFFILHDMNDIEDIELIRQIEEEYILFYTHETDYDVVNRRVNTSAFEKPKKSEKPKIKYKTIKIEENRLSEVLEILDERGVCYKYK